MKNYFQCSDSPKQIGVFVLSGFALVVGPGDFVSSACDPVMKRSGLPQMSLKWHNSPNARQKDLEFSYCVYRWLRPRPYQVTLFETPAALGWPFLVNDLEFPYQAVGCVLLINLYFAFALKVRTLSQRHSPPVKPQKGPSQLTELEVEESFRLASIKAERQKAWEQKCIQSPELLSDTWVTAKFKEQSRNITKLWEVGGIGWIRKNQLPFVVVPVEPEGSPVLALEEVLDVLEIDPTVPIVRCSMQRGYTFAPEDIERVLEALIEQIEGGER
jgi:hypothetical protein